MVAASSSGLTDFRLAMAMVTWITTNSIPFMLVATSRLPWRSYASTDIYYGSGFTNGNSPPDPNSHLPGHTTFDLTLGKDFGEHFALSVTGLNVANRRVLLDNSFTFGGTHYNYPREIFVQLRYRFHY